MSVNKSIKVDICLISNGYLTRRQLHVDTRKGPNDRFYWTVNTYDFDLRNSDVFFFWMFEGDRSNQGNQTNPQMSSPYFRITEEAEDSPYSSMSKSSTGNPVTLEKTPTAEKSTENTDIQSTELIAEQIKEPTTQQSTQLAVEQLTEPTAYQSPGLTPVTLDIPTTTSEELEFSTTPSFSTTTTGAAENSNDGAAESLESLSSGGKVGIGVGVGLGAIAVLVVIPLAIWRKKRKEKRRRHKTVSFWCQGGGPSQSKHVRGSGQDQDVPSKQPNTRSYLYGDQGQQQSARQSQMQHQSFMSQEYSINGRESQRYYYS